MLRNTLISLLLLSLFLYQPAYADTYLKITPAELNQIEKTLDEQNKLIKDYQEENSNLIKITEQLNKQSKQLEIENKVWKISTLTILTAFSAYYIYRRLD